uniref:MIP06912p n=2 Tax=Drosophila melanogaster TaxID=7227 RepID=C0PUZ7_DROME
MKPGPFTQVDCTNAMHLRQLLTEMVIILTILTIPGYTIHTLAEKKISQYPWIPKTSTHITPYKISGDI